MGILIVGKNEINKLLLDRLAYEGIESVIIENVENIRKIEGQLGNFNMALVNSDRDVFVTHIVITEEVARNPIPINRRSNGKDGNSSVNLTSNFTGSLPTFNIDELKSDAKESHLSHAYKTVLAYKNSPIIFIMDYPEESQPYNTSVTLEKAVELAKKKRKVFCLMKFLKTAGSKDGKLERLYKEARNLGITFVKYNDLDIDYDIEDSKFRVKFTSDCNKEESLVSDFLITADSFVPGENLNNIAEKLNLKLNRDGFINNNQNFLYPTLTSRKGVFILNPKLLSDGKEGLSDAVSFTISRIKEEIADLNEGMGEPKISVYAKIDKEKCAFCYTCYRVCPHNAMIPDHKNSVMECLINACYGCGICKTLCPANAISMELANKKNPNNNHKKEGRKGVLKIICCENSGEIAVRKALDEIYRKNRFESSPTTKNLIDNIEVTPISCGGEVSVEMIIDSLKDYERVLILTCIDEACKHFEGNLRARLYVEKARKTLRELGLDDNRIVHAQVSHAMPYVVCEYIESIVLHYL